MPKLWGLILTLGVISAAGCRTTRDITLTRVPGMEGTWRHCSLEPSNLGYFARTVTIGNGSVVIASGFYRDSDCLAVTPYKISSQFSSRWEGSNVLVVETLTGREAFEFQEINGYLYVPRQLLSIDSGEFLEGVDHNMPFKKVQEAWAH